MRNNRALVIVAVLLLFVALGGGYLWSQGMIGGSNEPEVVEGTPTPQITMKEIVVAAQDIPAGQQLKEADGAVKMQPWPEDALPIQYIESMTEAEGQFARMDIARGMPVLSGALGKSGGGLSVYGSSAALFDDKNRRAYVIPMDTQGAVAWAIQPGDRVDVLTAVKLMPVDTEFQTRLPNSFIPLEGSGGGGTTGDEPQGLVAGREYKYGRFEDLPNGTPAFIISPSGEPTPSYLVVQMTVQNAIVWHVGTWEEESPSAVDTGAAAEEETGNSLTLGEGGGQEAATTAPAPLPEKRGMDSVLPVTLLVSPQDALVLKYLQEMGADLDLVLRSTGDESPIITEAVWFRYVMDYYQIPSTLPDMPVAPTPLTTPLEFSTPTPPPAEE
ncbi:MAG: Flp pilus assembly protein CpaB [Chloroflexota bacterium]|nr:Flp pilus assembly protein CpaB [Chloroflexota bacterium]